MIKPTRMMTFLLGTCYCEHLAVQVHTFHMKQKTWAGVGGEWGREEKR